MKTKITYQDLQSDLNIGTLKVLLNKHNNVKNVCMYLCNSIQEYEECFKLIMNIKKQYKF